MLFNILYEAKVFKNAVRFRLSKSEVTLLNKNGELFETIQYGPDSNDQFHYGIEKAIPLIINSLNMITNS